MKKIANVLLVVALISGLFIFDSFDVFTQKVSANEISNDENLITVNGSGIVKVKPDIAYINLGVENFEKDAQLAQSKTTEAMNKIMSELKKSGIDEKDIKTITYNIYKTQKYESPVNGFEKERMIEGYESRHIVEVTVRNIENIGKIIDVASKAGVNNINSIRFGLVDEEKHYNEALKIAMNNASNKAKAISSTFGGNISKPYSIDENSYSSPILYRESEKYSAMDQSSAPVVETGELDITARIVVKYRY